jgi:hypothetical protein
MLPAIRRFSMNGSSDEVRIYFIAYSLIPISSAPFEGVFNISVIKSNNIFYYTFESFF